MSENTITGYTGSATDIIIPITINGDTVKTIGSSAFYLNSLTSVTIPNSVTAIERTAFASNSLTSVTIPSSVTAIGENAFRVNSLTTVTIEENSQLNSIEADAFASNTSLTSISFPTSDLPNVVGWKDNLGNSYAIGDSFDVFDRSYSLRSQYVLTAADVTMSENSITDYTGSETDIIIPTTIDGDTVKVIEGYAFYQNSLTSVTIPNSVTKIHSRAFQSNSLTSVTIPNGVNYIGQRAFAFNSLTSVTIANSVTAIGTGAFYRNYLKSLTIPNSVTSIGWDAFANNILTSVSIPNSVTSIGKSAFENNYLTSLTIPNSVTAIGEKAFYNNSLESVTIEENSGLKSINANAFAYNFSLTAIIFPTSVVSDIIIGWVDSGDATYDIGDGFSMFSRSYLLKYTLILSVNDVKMSENTITDYIGSATDIIIPITIDGDTVKAIGSSAFRSNSLTSVTIPNSVIAIGENAFRDNSLTSVTIPNSVIDIGESAFQYNDLTSITIPNSMTAIGENAFSNNSLTSVTIPNSVTTIGSSAFQSNSLTSVTIANSVTTIGNSAFQSNSLTSVTIEENSGLISIGANAFASNASLTSITPPLIIDGIWRDDAETDYMLGDSFNVFSRRYFFAPILNASDVKMSENTITDYTGTARNIIIPITIDGDTVKTIGSDAFEDNSLTSVSIPNSVTAIGESAFEYNNLKLVTIPNSVTAIGRAAFANNNLTSVSIPNSVTTIGNYAFSFNYSITSVTIPNSVTSIGSFAFCYNKLLTRRLLNANNFPLTK